MKPVVVLPLLLCGLTGCADLSRSAYRDSREINRYSRRNMAETARNIPMAPIHPRGVPRNQGYAGYSGPGYTPYSASYFIPDSGPRRGARLSADVVPPPYSPGLYGPTRDASSVSVSSGIGGRRFRYADRNPYYGGYYPYYGGDAPYSGYSY